MNYTSTVTSKGTITLPAEIRARLGIEPGNEVNIELHGDTISVKPKGGWEEFFVVGAKMRQDLERRGMKVAWDLDKLRADVDAVKTAEYAEKYLPKSRRGDT